jgi:hypothetical protein
MDSFVAPGTIFHQHQPVIEGNIYKLGHNISSLQGSGNVQIDRAKADTYTT